MSLIKEVARQRFIHYAIMGTKAVLARELELKNIVVTMSEMHRAEYLRKTHDNPVYPYCFLELNSLAGEADTQNNFAMRKIGVTAQTAGTLAMTRRAFMFPFAIELSFHCIETDQNKVIDLATALAILSSTSALSFKSRIDCFEMSARIEIPPSVPIAIAEEENASTPEAVDVTTSIIVHASAGFMRDVSAVNSDRPVMNITVVNTMAGTAVPEEYSFSEEIDP